MVSQDFQKKYLILQTLKQELDSMIEQKKNIEQKMNELITTQIAIENMKNLKTGNEIWTTLGSGSFIISKIDNVDDIIISVGYGVAIKKKKEKAYEIIKSRIVEIEKLNNELENLINKNAMQTFEIEKELQKMSEKEK